MTLAILPTPDFSAYFHDDRSLSISIGDSNAYWRNLRGTLLYFERLHTPVELHHRSAWNFLQIRGCFAVLKRSTTLLPIAGLSYTYGKHGAAEIGCWPRPVSGCLHLSLFIFDIVCRMPRRARRVHGIHIVLSLLFVSLGYGLPPKTLHQGIQDIASK